jgi:peroxiredoxin
MAARTLPTVSWIALRHLLIPALYVPYKMGIEACWAYRIDSYVKRTLFPLTERPATKQAEEIRPALRTGDSLPDVQVKQRGGLEKLSTLAQGRPLLLVLFRGSWCPYSRMHLTDLAKGYPALRDSGVEVLAVSTRRDEHWWRSKGVDLPLAADREGALFAAMGVRMPQTLNHKVWGALLPHEGVFLFDKSGKLVTCDVRNVKNTKMGQRFLSAQQWLDICRSTGTVQ